MKGIPNQGSSCYIAAVLQTALSSATFNAALVQAANRDKAQLLAHPLLGAYCRVVNQVTNTKAKYIDVSPLRNALVQYDAAWANQSDSIDLLIFVCSKFADVGESNLLDFMETANNTRDCGHSNQVEIKSDAIFSITDADQALDEIVLQRESIRLTDCPVCGVESFTRITHSIHRLPRLLCFRANGLLTRLQNSITVQDTHY